MKTISIFLALLNSLFAGFLIALDLSYTGIHQNTLGWSLMKLSVLSLVIVIGVGTWLDVMGVIRPGLTLLGNVVLIALGPVTVTWAIHVALTNGDIKYHMVAYGISLMVQGISSLLGSAVEREPLIS